MKRTSVWIGVLLVVAGGVIFSSCEEDPILTPSGDEEEECTGSYCTIEMNASDNLAYTNQNNNPETF